MSQSVIFYTYTHRNKNDGHFGSAYQASVYPGALQYRVISMMIKMRYMDVGKDDDEDDRFNEKYTNTCHNSAESYGVFL